MRMAVLAVVWAVSLRVLAGPRAASADEPASSAQEPAPPSSKPDTTYGRVDGYVDLAFGAGAAFGPGGPRSVIDFRARYLETAGLFLTYEEGGLFRSSADPLRVIAGGLEVRPLFVARWLTGRETGNARADLILDSFGLELGGYLAQPNGGSLGDQPGFQAGLGLEAPVYAQASGPWVGVRGGIRWSEAGLSGSSQSGAADRAMYLTITLSWHQVVSDRHVDVSSSGP
jgi:hypothetical protein